MAGMKCSTCNGRGEILFDYGLVTAHMDKCPNCHQGVVRTPQFMPKGDGTMSAAIDHPRHYGGAEDPFEHVKVCEAKGWGYHIGNCTKYLWRAGIKTPDLLQDLKKARWYLDRYIQLLEKSAPDHFLITGTGPHLIDCPQPHDQHATCPRPEDTRATMMREKK